MVGPPFPDPPSPHPLPSHHPRPDRAKPPGLTQSDTKETQTHNLGGPWSRPVDTIPRQDLPETEKKERKWGGRKEKERNVWPPTLLAPTLRARGNLQIPRKALYLSKKKEVRGPKKKFVSQRVSHKKLLPFFQPRPWKFSNFHSSLFDALFPGFPQSPCQDSPSFALLLCII